MTTMTDTSIDPAEAWTTYRHDHLDELSDRQLVAWAGRHVAVPREAPADSFVLHAPLELAARAALLPFVTPAGRDLARVRLLTLAGAFERSGPAYVPPASGPSFDRPDEAATALVAAMERGELDDVDAAASWIGRHAGGTDLRSLLTGPVLPLLGAAAHAPIFLYQLPRVAPRGEVTAELLRGLARELGRYPDWRLHWIDDESARRRVAMPAGAPAEAVFESIASTPIAPIPDLFFIFPMMAHVDTEGVAAAQLGSLASLPPAEVAEAGRAVLRVAAWSMLLEGDDHAPYGWSHCLTLPQGVLGIAAAAPDPVTALQVAATYVVGFRTAHAERPIITDVPTDPGVSWREALETDRSTAAAAAWHVPVDERAALVAELATRASTQHDAHLVKYTLACLDAAYDDPGHAPLFLAAAASLGAWWHVRGNPDDPLG